MFDKNVADCEKIDEELWTKEGISMKAQDILDRISEKITEFVEKGDGHFPTKLHLTLREEGELGALPHERINKLCKWSVKDVMEKGTQTAVEDSGNKVCDLDVVWRAKEFKVE